VNIEIINTGSELMLGFVLNTHQQWLCRKLADLGYEVTRQVAVADTGSEIEQAVREALGRADLVITTGGLGPTSDDITRDRIAGLLGLSLTEDASILRHIEGFFLQRHRTMPANTSVQALVPDGAVVLANAHGTAPGLVMEVPGGRFRAGASPSLLVMLPGPPRELRPMFTEQVVPILREKLPLAGDFICRVFKTTGIGESLVEERIAGLLRPLTDRGLALGYCARVGEVDVRCVARGAEARSIVDEAERIIQERLAEHLFGRGDASLEETVIRLCAGRRLTITLAESCTGGFIANRLTNVPGASAVFSCGLVTYSNEAKRDLLGVSEDTLRLHGAVSAETAAAMADGARRKGNADYALAVTGIAGPGGGTEDKPVGTVFIALAGKAPTRVVRMVNRYDRETFKQVTSQQSIEMLRRAILSETGP
jgi:nicotinamide-nucleotide amidase